MTTKSDVKTVIRVLKSKLTTARNKQGTPHWREVRRARRAHYEAAVKAANKATLVALALANSEHAADAASILGYKDPEEALEEAAAAEREKFDAISDEIETLELRSALGDDLKEEVAKLVAKIEAL
jgi:hypothetical protein